MWFYADGGWFFRREPEGGITIVKLSGEVRREHPAATVVAEAVLDGDTFKRLLAQLTGRSVPEAEAFITPPVRPV